MDFELQNTKIPILNFKTQGIYFLTSIINCMKKLKNKVSNSKIRILKNFIF